MRCVVDTSVWIDLHRGDLLAQALALAIEFLASGGPGDIDGVYGELAAYADPDPKALAGRGVRFVNLEGVVIAHVVNMTTRYRRCSVVDLGVLALAKAEGVPLLTSDTALRNAARREDVAVSGTEWLLARMVASGTLTQDGVAQFKDDMRVASRRVPTI